MTSAYTERNDTSVTTKKKKRTNVKPTHSENKIFSEKKFPEVIFKIFVKTFFKGDSLNRI